MIRVRGFCKARAAWPVDPARDVNGRGGAGHRSTVVGVPEGVLGHVRFAGFMSALRKLAGCTRPWGRRQHGARAGSRCVVGSPQRQWS